MISIIGAIGKNNEIGKGNKLLWNLPTDLKHFKEITTGHPVVMGQKTFQSIGKPLPNRRNIVLTLDNNFKENGIEVFHSIEELENNFKNEKDEVFIIGGGTIYNLFIDKVDKLYITHVDASFPDADTFFPKIDKDKWQKIKEEKFSPSLKDELGYSFVEYLKI
jgi:dihydrofolate reductase